MNSHLILRLGLPGLMAIAILLSLAYWWLENVAHEIFGSVLFILLTWHIIRNRSWFSKLLRGRYDLVRGAVVGLHLLLIVNMAVLLVTSVVISKTVFAGLPIPDSVYLRDVHWFAAYWVIIVVGIHLGVHWTRVMAMVRTSLSLKSEQANRAWILRFLSIAGFIFGLWSWVALGVGAKLTFTYSLDFWDFTASVAPFFGHWAGVLALPAIVTHYALLAARRSPLKARKGG